jgi:hypothetical protein
MYVPAHLDGTIVEQRIIEQAPRVEDHGAITGWASLRWQGARFFDGLADGGRTVLPVPLQVHLNTRVRSAPGITVTRERRRPEQRDWVGGLWCTIPERAVFDEVRRTRSLVQGVIAVDMAAAAGLITVRGMWEFIYWCNAMIGVPHVRRVLPYASDDSRSPPESAMRLVWLLDAGLPAPLCNQPVFSLQGDLLGIPDLFDPEAGLVGEYDGDHHADADQRRTDREREEGFRDHGLEYFAVVKGQLGNNQRVARRMLAARRRALWLPPDQRAWTLDQPAWWRERHGG